MSEAAPIRRPVALITGASAGIGAEFARVFARHGHEMVLVARREQRLRDLADQIAAAGGQRPHLLTIDLGRQGASQQIAAELAALGVKPQYLVNNAGFGLLGPAVELDHAEQLEMIDLNVRVLVELSLAFIDSLGRHRGGILNVASVSSFLPGPGMAVYYASKAFVLSFSESLHEELRGTKIQVTNLCPGPTESNFSSVARSHRAREAQAKKMSAAEVARIGHRDFRAGIHISLPGAINKISAFAPRVFPRAVVRRLIGRYNKLK